jgi:hypothetical protein
LPALQDGKNVSGTKLFENRTATLRWMVKDNTECELHEITAFWAVIL